MSNRIDLALLLLALATTACGADVTSTRVDASRRSVHIAGRSPEDVEAVMDLCTRLTLTAGQSDLVGSRDLLSCCRTPAGDIDFDLLSSAAGTPTRAVRFFAITGALGAVNETFPALPTVIATRVIPRQAFSPLLWVIPLVDDALANAGIPDLARRPVLAAVEALVATATCELTGTVTATFRRAPLENLDLRFSGTGGAHLRVTADIADGRTVANYRINTAFACNGSTSNLVHATLQAIFPNRNHVVTVPDGDVRARVFFDPAPTRVEGSVDARVNIDTLAVEKAVPWISDEAWAGALAAAGVTPAVVEADLEPRLADALDGLGDGLSTAVTDSLDLARSEVVQSVSVDTSTPPDLVVGVFNTFCFVNLAGRRICLPPGGI